MCSHKWWYDQDVTYVRPIEQQNRKGLQINHATTQTIVVVADSVTIKIRFLNILDSYDDFLHNRTLHFDEISVIVC